MRKAPQPRFRFYNSKRNYLTVIRDAAAGRLTSGDAVEVAEQKLQHYLGSRNVILTPQGRVAIYLGLLEVIQPGKKVILSPYTLYDVINMVIASGAVPVFADIDQQTCNISAAEIERLIDTETCAVLITHLHGLTCETLRIKSICDAHGVPLLEDACQALGARRDGYMAGTVGEFGFFSCGRAKNINAFLGGFLATNDDNKAIKIRERLRRMPMEGLPRLGKRIAHCLLGDILTAQPVFSAFTYWVFRYGAMHDVAAVTRQFNTEANPVKRNSVPEHYLRATTPLQARLILDQLSSVDALSRERIKLANLYREGLCDIPNILLPPQSQDFEHIYLSFPIQVPDRIGLQKFMMRDGRDVVIQHIGNTAELDCFPEFATECPNARRTAQRVLLLPTWPGYRTEEAEKNVDSIRRFFRTGNRAGRRG